MKEFISNDDFEKVLKLLGLPGETLEFTLGGRGDEVMTGVESSWRMRAVVGDSPGLPYSTRTFYVPVLLPYDQERYDERMQRLTQSQLEHDRMHAELVHDKPVEHAFLPDEVATAEVVAPALRSGGWCAPTDVELRGVLRWDNEKYE